MEKSIKTSKQNKKMEAKNTKIKNKFKIEVIKIEILGGQEDWQRVAEITCCIARMELGKTSEKVSTAGRRETWWLNQEVQEKLKNKRKAKKVWDVNRDDASKLAYTTARKQAKREMAKAKTRHTRNCTKNWKQRREK